MDKTQKQQLTELFTGLIEEGGREQVLAQVTKDAKLAELMLFESIMQHPDNGFLFAGTMQNLLSVLNPILHRNNLALVHIQEFDLITVKTIEDFTKMDFDDAYDKFMDGGHDYEQLEKDSN